MRLEEATLEPPSGLEKLLADLGEGESGFSGTPVHSGEVSLDEYLRQCRDMKDPAKIRPGRVPQTVFWALDDDGEAIGIARIRHYLNDRTRIRGGHLGYFVRSDRRGKGYGKEVLRLALLELRRFGESRALITTDSDNVRSIRVIEANGGYFAGVGTHPRTGKEYRRYWIDLQP
jgi:predicted acetyltransferase